MIYRDTMRNIKTHKDKTFMSGGKSATELAIFSHVLPSSLHEKNLHPVIMFDAILFPLSH